ncbi:MAG: lytic transglycosylase domain-containing protein [Vulcanimicrobiota bacterium]
MVLDYLNRILYHRLWFQSVPEGVSSVNIRDHSLQQFRNSIIQRDSSAPISIFPNRLNIESIDSVSTDVSNETGSEILTPEKARELAGPSVTQPDQEPSSGFSRKFKQIMASTALLFSALISPAGTPPVQAAPLSNEIARTMVVPEKPAQTAATASAQQAAPSESAKNAQSFDGEYVASTGDWHYKSDEAYKDFEPVPITVTKRIAVKHGAGKRTTFRNVRTEEDIAPYILSAAKRHDVSPYVVKAMIAKESTFNPRAHSNRGACGLMQLLPGTAREMGVRDHWDPEKNIEAGTKYINKLLEDFGDLSKALSAYNTGPNNVRKSKHGIPRYTRGYIAKIMDFMKDNTGPKDL